MGRYQNAASRAGQAASYIRPEIMAIPAGQDEEVSGGQGTGPLIGCCSSGCCATSRTRLPTARKSCWPCRAKCRARPSQIFRQLNNADLKFGAIKNERGEMVELSHASFSSLSALAEARRARGGLSSVLPAIRGPRKHAGRHAGRLGAARRLLRQGPRLRQLRWPRRCFPTTCRKSVYDNLIAAVHRNLPALHRYYDLRRRKMKLKDIHHYDTYVPILSELENAAHLEPGRRRRRSQSLEPLGSEYCGVLERGSPAAGAIATRTRASRAARSARGSFDGDPYILMNFQADVLDHVFTLAHEAGHSMHSLSTRPSTQPFQYYNYTIFVAEVASTFNEQLLAQASDAQVPAATRERAFLINREIDAIRGTILRQTMFAEFEKHHARPGRSRTSR